MGRFYLRVFRDGIRERTWGCGSRGENHQHYKEYLQHLLECAEGYRGGFSRYSDVTLGKTYRLELIKNRCGEKQLYREIDLELIIPENKDIDVHLIKNNDITYITEGYDPRILVLPPDW